jgi:hypothetical protein
MDLEVMCLDCEEQWDPDFDPPHCICDDPAEDAWLLFIRDAGGKWVKSTMNAIEARHFFNDQQRNYGTD